MTGIIKEITCFTEKKNPGKALNKAVLIEDIGMEGDIHEGGDRQLCLFALEAKQWMKEQEIQGLCFQRFKENLLLEHLPVEKLCIGQQLKINKAIIGITAFKHACYDDCPRVIARLSCRLRNNVCFAVVQNAGSIAVGDEIIAIS